MANNAPSKYISLTLLILSPLYFALAYIAQFPATPKTLRIHPSLASLPPDSRSRIIYPEDIYENGSYVDLPSGRTRYWLLGPENGDKVVLLHGLSVPSIIWKDVAPVVAQQGFRVLLYDIYGRGYSDAPQHTYDANLLTTQLALLMQHVRWDSAHLVGFSMGGAVAVAFAASFPDLCSGNIALISSAGIMETPDFSRTSRFMSAPLVQWVASSSVVRMYLQQSSGPPVNVLHEIVQIQSAFLPGFNFALASSLRDGPLRGQEEAFLKLGKAPVNVLLISGTADRTVPYTYASKMHELMPNNSRLLTVEGGQHDLPWVQPVVVREAIIDFLRTSKTTRNRGMGKRLKTHASGKKGLL